MTTSTIHSKPKYVPLDWDTQGRVHLLAAHGDGGECLLRLLDASPPSGPVAVRYAREPVDQSDCSARLARAAPHSFRSFDAIEPLLDALRAEFAAGNMGLRLYLAGSERFVWSAIGIAAGFGLCADEIRCEHYRNPQRSVYCVHCKATTPQVSTNVTTCRGCARTLMVRDHYSARLAAYMGFQVDAEVAGAIPPIERLYA